MLAVWLLTKCEKSSIFALATLARSGVRLLTNGSPFLLAGSGFGPATLAPLLVEKPLLEEAQPAAGPIQTIAESAQR